MITQEYLKSILHYDPETGVFMWIEAKKGRQLETPIGSKNYKGYLLLYINDRLHRCHRLAWLYMTGKWPDNHIDHINNIKNDNRWSNLREANNQLNHYNLLKPKNNTSGAKGVRKLKTGKYQARIKYDQKEIYLGVYNTLEEASNVYLNKAKELAAQFANRGHN